MFNAIKHSTGFAAVLVAAVSFGSMMSVSDASASDLYEVVVVPAEGDQAHTAASVITPATHKVRFNASSMRVQPRVSRARVVPAQMRSATRSTRPQFAWPYTARTIDVK